MAYSKITQNGQVLIDLTNDTITQNVLRPGYTAHDASGAIVEGSYVPSVTQDEDGYLVLDEDGDAPDFFDMSKPQGVMVTDRTTLPSYCGAYRTGIVSVIAPNATSIENNAFLKCQNITSIIAPNVTRIEGYAFSGCSKLQKCYLPLAKGASSSNIFADNTSLEGLVLPGWNVASNTAVCYKCSNLKYFDAPILSLGQNFFFNCTILDTIVLRRTGAIVTVGNLNAFTNTPYANGGSGGVIYVPSDLISTYESATNWSTLVGYGTLEFKAIEGSEYETHYADGTEIPT